MKTKKFLSALLCVFMLTYFSACEKNSNARISSADDVNRRFEVHFIDVGQGDAALLICDGETMLIDGGKPEASDIIYTYLKKQNIEKLNYIVCSHADDDHIGGLSAPLANMSVENILAPETTADTRAYKSLIQKANLNNVPITHPKCGESMDFASTEIDFFGPVTESADDRNNGSIVMKVIYGETSFLFTGDAEREEESEILGKNYDVSATVLKVGHHGSKNSTTYPFLREVMPQYAVISVGDNSYGHPTDDVLSRLRDADTKVYRTDMQGDIIAKSDGKTVTVTTAKNKNAQTNPTAVPSPEISRSEHKATDTEQITVGKYIANKGTKKFHLPTCRAVKSMKEENKTYLDCTREEAIENGFDPCKMCKP